MSETDAPVEILRLPTTEVGEAFSTQDIERIFYTSFGKPAPHKVSWEKANRLESNGTFSFFRDFPNLITTYPNNEYYVHEKYHRDKAPIWRKLRDMFFDNLVKQRFFRTDLAEPQQTRADLYLVGRHLEIELDEETNEIRSRLLDWVVFKTHVVET